MEVSRRPVPRVGNLMSVHGGVRAPSVPSDFAERTWRVLSEALESIRGGREPVAPLETLYATVEDACLLGLGSWLYGELTADMAVEASRVVARLESVSSGGAAQGAGARAGAGASSESSPIEVLKAIVRIWDEYVASLRRVRQIFLLLDHGDVAAERGPTTWVEAGSLGPSLLEYGLEALSARLVRSPSSLRALSAGFLAAVRADRAADGIDAGLVKAGGADRVEETSRGGSSMEVEASRQGFVDFGGGCETDRKSVV